MVTTARNRPGVALAAVGDASRWVAPLRDALASTGTGVVEHPEAGSITIVLLPPGQSSTEDADQFVGLGLADPIIPVVIGSSASTLLADRSQVVRPATALSEVAERIASLTRLGGADLVAVNDLLSAARRWVAHGRRPTDLLSSSRTTDAIPLATLAGSVYHAEAGLLGEFTVASARLQAEHRRRRRRIVTVAVAVLSSAIVAAFATKLGSDYAADDARRQAAVATSNRLTGIVNKMVHTYSDPDLPWLLAQRALSSDPSPDAVSVARLVLDAIPAHRSIRLAKRPVSLRTASTGEIAIVSADRSVDVLDSTGSTVRSFPAGVASAAIALSDDGTRLALATESGLLLNDEGSLGFEESADTHATIPGKILGLAWTAELLIVATPDRLLAFAADGTSKPVPDVPELGAIAGVASSPDGRRLAVWGTKGLWAGDVDGRNSFTSGSVDVSTAIFTADARILYTHSRRGAVGHIEFPTGRAPVVVPATVGAFSIFRVGDQIGVVKWPGTICPISPPAGDAARCLTVHTGGIVGAGSLGPPRGYATVGSDQYLRIWTTLGAGTYGSRYANGTENNFQYVNGSTTTRLQGRSQLECDRGNGVCWALSGESGILDGLDIRLKSTRTLYVGQQGLLNHALASGGRYAGWHSRDQGVVVRELRNTSALTDVWRATQSGAWVNSMDALAPDGSVYVSASASTVAFWTKNGMTSSAGPSSNPVGIVFDETRGTTVYFNDGSTVHSGTGEPRTVNDRLRAVAGVTIDGNRQLWWINDRNEVRMSDSGGQRLVKALPSTVAPFAMRVSPDGRHVAIFDPSETLILATSDGSVRFAAISESDMANLDDVAFEGNRALTIDRSGALRWVVLTDAAEFVTIFIGASPRALTPEESSLFALT